MARALIASVVAIASLVLLLPAFATAGVLALFASCVRAIGRLLEPPFVPWTELMAFDQELGWKPRPNLDARYLASNDDVFRVVTDAEGWPGRRSLDESRIVVIGDSFAFGYGVDAGRSFAEVDDSGIEIKAVGAPGYSMVHGVLLMEQLAERLAGKLVVWFVYLENDLEDNLSPAMTTYRTPFIRPAGADGGWEIVRRHVAPGKWHSSMLEHTRLFPRLCVPGPLADRAYAACEYLIERASTSCRRAGARLAVVTIPHPMQLSTRGAAQLAGLSGAPGRCDPDLPDRRIAECCRSAGVARVAGKDHLSDGDYKRREGIHWNERGHRRMAALLRQLDETVRPGALDQAVCQPDAVAGCSVKAVDARHFDPTVGSLPS